MSGKSVSHVTNQDWALKILAKLKEKREKSNTSGKRSNLHTGSSKMTNFGSPIRAIATLRRRFIPPL